MTGMVGMPSRTLHGCKIRMKLRLGLLSVRGSGLGDDMWTSCCWLVTSKNNNKVAAIEFFFA